MVRLLDCELTLRIAFSKRFDAPLKTPNTTVSERRGAK